MNGKAVTHTTVNSRKYTDKGETFPRFFRTETQLDAPAAILLTHPVVSNAGEHIAYEFLIFIISRLNLAPLLISCGRRI